MKNKLYNNALIGALLLAMLAVTYLHVSKLYIVYAGKEAIGTVHYTQTSGIGKNARTYTTYSYTDDQNTYYEASFISRPTFWSGSVQVGDAIIINYLPSDPSKIAFYSPTLFFMPAFTFMAVTLFILFRVYRKKNPIKK